MIKEVKLLVALALVATCVGCHPISEDESKNDEVVSSPWDGVVRGEVSGLKLEVPVYEDKIFTKQRRDQEVRQFQLVRAQLLTIAHKVIIQRKSLMRVGKEAWGFVSICWDAMKASKELSKTDTSPPMKKTFGPDMSRLVEDILKTKTDLTDMKPEEIYARVETILEATDELNRNSPVGLYLDWNKMIIDGESIHEYVAPIIHWLRNNGYGLMLNVLSKVGGLFKKIGNHQE